MTEQYRKRLVELAKEIVRFNEPMNISEATQNPEVMRKNKEIQYQAKVQHLLGYIMALDDEEM